VVLFEQPGFCQSANPACRQHPTGWTLAFTNLIFTGKIPFVKSGAKVGVQGRETKPAKGFLLLPAFLWAF
jgi:hypothetical protein